jgi:outer membrane protein OmpA-like peptidoglycan-associated protein
MAANAAPAADDAVARVQIPFMVGLNTVRAVASDAGDYEILRVIDAIDPAGYRIVASGEVPADDGNGLLDVRIVRAVRAEDQLASRKMRVYFHTGDAEKFPGTVPGFSAAVVNDLRKTGKAPFTYLDVSMMFGMATTRELAGTLLRMDGPATLPMLVNGRSVLLPVIHAGGSLSDGSDAQDFDFHVLDDPGNPIVLRWSGAGSTSQVTRIEYPEPDAIERTLAANDTAEVYGIYFSFARADIRPQSERVLKEIASMLNAHPDWKLRIDGHTDAIGNDAANLDLSKRRAAAVKAALVSRFRIDASRLGSGGYGESSPRDKNDTPEGRARNRRVELRRE